MSSEEESSRKRIKEQCSKDSSQQSLQRHPTVDEVRPHFQHCKRHMELDFDYHNQMTFSPEYLDQLLHEWCEVAIIPKVKPPIKKPRLSSTRQTGFLSLEGFRELAHNMYEKYNIQSWKLDSIEDLEELQRDFFAERYWSLRRFCLYVEHEVLYDAHEQARRLELPNIQSNQGQSATSTTPTKSIAYQGPYSAYRRHCSYHMALDMKKDGQTTPVNLIESYLLAFEQEDPDETGFVDQDAVWKILQRLAAKDDTTQQSKQVVLQRLQLARELLQRTDLPAINQGKSLEYECKLRIDSEFGGDEGYYRWKEEGRLRKKTHSPIEYKVSLRDYSTFVERPMEDYYTFPTNGFDERLKMEVFSPLVESVLNRYYQNTVFQLQVQTFRLIHSCCLGRPLTDSLVYTILSYLPYNLEESDSSLTTRRTSLTQ